MEYLKSTKQIEDEIKEDNRLIDNVLFPDYDDLDLKCPICKTNYKHINWWCCKFCGKNINIDDFIEYLIKEFK